MVSRLLISLLVLVGSCRGFVLQGNWKLVHDKDFLPPTVLFHVKEHEISTKTDTAAMLFTGIDWTRRGNLIELDIAGIDVLKYPRDWYNVMKYRRYATVFDGARKYGIKALIDIGDEDTLMITATVGEKFATTTPFLLKRV